MTDSWQKLLVISASLKTKLLQRVAEKTSSAKELASNFGYDQRAVELVMEALKEMGLVSFSKSGYHATEAAAPYTDENNPFYRANALLHSARLIENWTKLDAAIITGKSQSRRRTPEELEIFIRSMDEYSKPYADEVVSLILAQKKDAKTALDLGGALGTFSKPFADAGVKATLMDTEAVAALSKKYLSHPLIKIVAGDFSQELPQGPFDIILMSNITHIYRAEKLEVLFNRVKERLNENGLIAIVDFVHGKSEGAAMFGVNMLVHTAGGGTWTLSQYEEWLENAGLKLDKMLNLKNANQKLLIARKASS